ncbi:response regulator [Spirulina sp. CS-785/01]|nr:response regulator [Spirulina sp. CS-785/01]MDB9315490.1 response regulator [Spirulina sp. CS-785/01]
MERRKKPKMLVVDDEPDNLDLLYRTFRRDFKVFKADSGMSALDVLSQEGEVAVIISDQRMPEMKGTEFLSKTVSNFPDTVRIILTGFTDVEDLVDAINSGQVYKYITKPWDPNELKDVVDHAAETYDLLKQRTEELIRANEQAKLLAAIAQVAQDSSTLDDCLNPLATAFGESFSADGCVVQQVKDGQLGSQGSYGKEGISPVSLDNDPLVQTSISEENVKVWVKSSSNPPPEGTDYEGAGLQMHLIFPLAYRGTPLATLSLQWMSSQKPSEEEIKLMHLAAQQAVLAVAVVNCMA